MKNEQVVRKFLHARRMQARLATRLKRTVTLWDHWSRKAAYYQKKLALG